MFKICYFGNQNQSVTLSFPVSPRAQSVLWFAVWDMQGHIASRPECPLCFCGAAVCPPPGSWDMAKQTPGSFVLTVGGSPLVCARLLLSVLSLCGQVWG